MRKIVISIVSASVVAAPLQAAAWQDQGSEARRGAFIGAQFRISFGGRDRPQPHAQLAIAPTQTRISGSGLVRTRIGEGLALRFSPGDKPTLNLAGSGRKLGISNGGWIAIGLGVAALAGGVYLLHLIDEAEKNSE